MLNKTILIGRLTRDPVLKYTPSGLAVASFTLAVDRPFTNQQGKQEADFIPIVVWRKQAENCANYLGKGRLVAVEGRMQPRSYDDQNGNKRYITEVIANVVKFLDFAKDNNNQQTATQGITGEEMDISDEDIPF